MNCLQYNLLKETLHCAGNARDSHATYLHVNILFPFASGRNVFLSFVNRLIEHLSHALLIHILYFSWFQQKTVYRTHSHNVQIPRRGTYQNYLQKDWEASATVDPRHFSKNMLHNTLLLALHFFFKRKDVMVTDVITCSNNVNVNFAEILQTCI